MFVTNNSTKSRAGYLGKFTSLGLNVKAVSGRLGGSRGLATAVATALTAAGEQP